MRERALGATGLSVSIVGLGAGPLGDLAFGDADADALVGRAIDLGVTFFDTARSYGASEDRLGRALACAPARRRGVVLATKGGYGTSAPDWTPEAIRLGVDDALRRLRTDVVDVFFFHSCAVEVASKDDLAGELARAKEAGKIRAAGYSGDGDALAWAIDSGRFDVVECSVSPFDQAAVTEGALARASARGIGVVAKRALGNAPWRYTTPEPPSRDDERLYWERMRAMALDPSPLAWPEAALRFTAHEEGVASALVGTTSPAHLEAAVRAAERGPLATSQAARFREAWNMHASRGGWRGVI